jgi:F420-non-reducing hydrogenase large subunit
MSKRIIIDPITRLEGHGKINIFLDSNGDVERAYLQVPDFKGFEKFCEGRAAEEMPAITQKICGVCPTAHHTASCKGLDDLFKVDPPPAAKKLRELMYNAFIFEDHLLHLFVLGGPDLFVGSDVPRNERNVFGVIQKLGVEIGKKVINIRNKVRGVNAAISGSPLYPVCGLPGGVSKGLTEEERVKIQVVAREAVEFGELAMQLFLDKVFADKAFADLLRSDIYYHDTYYMGMVDQNNTVNFYDGKIRVVDPEGKELVKFEAGDYLNHVEERVEPWTYLKMLYLKDVGWRGFVSGKDSGVYRVGPLARLNVSEGMATPLAQAAFDKMFDVFGSRPVHNTLAYHWARVIEVLYAAERMEELARDKDLVSPHVRNVPDGIPDEGFGVCEAPRGTLFHHYTTNREGMIEKVNLLVGTQNSAAAICMSIEKAARALIKGGSVSGATLNMIEMAFRAYDPCLACATHCLGGVKQGMVLLYDKDKRLIEVIEPRSGNKEI